MMKKRDQTASKSTPRSVASVVLVLGQESERLWASISPSIKQNHTYPRKVKWDITNPPALGFIISFLVPSLLYLVCFWIAFRQMASGEQLA